MEQVVSECERAGHELIEVSPVFDYEEYLRATCVAWSFGLYAGMEMFAAMTGRKISEETLEPVMLSFYTYSKGLTPADMFMTEFALNKFPRTFGKFFEQYDMLLTPTFVKLPETIGKYTKMRTDIDYVGYMRLCDEVRIHPPAANVTGQPAISLPGLGRKTHLFVWQARLNKKCLGVIGSHLYMQADNFLNPNLHPDPRSTRLKAG